MYFKSLEIQGFKSFPDRVKIELTPGITAIVGPNGCGKSNIADAIRWVLGEQNPYNLRGTKMEEVIFNGSEGRKPLGRAEVSLTFENPRRNLPFPFSEITITRKLFRSGESEYQINRTSCRLKDIQELFMDTGIGVSGYSFLSQEMVEYVVMAKPRERRRLFEEAAGITRFNLRKQETLRKLEFTRQNLIRLKDLLREMERQLRSLERQASKARRYHQLKERLKELELREAALHYSDLRERMKSILKDKEKKEGERNKFLKILEEKEKSLSERRKILSDLEREREEIQEREATLREESMKLSGLLLLCEERIKKAQEEINKGEEEIKEVENTLSSLRERKREVEERIKVIEEEKQRKEKKLKEILSLLGERRKVLDEQNKILEKLNSQKIENLSSLVKERNNLQHLKIGLHNLEVRIYKLLKEREKEEEEKGRVEKNLEEVERNLRKREDSIKEISLKREALLKEKERLEREIEVLKERREKCEQERNRLKERLKLLKEIWEEGGHLDPAVKFLRQEREVKLLGDLIRVPENLTLAVESVLEEVLQTLVVDDLEEAKEILKKIKEAKKGKVSIYPCSQGGRGKKMTGELLSRIDYPPYLAPLLERLLGKVLILPSLEEALKKLKEVPPEWKIVTLEGEIVSPSGLIKGVYKKEEVFLTGKEERIRKLERGEKEREDELKKITEEIKEKEKFLKENNEKLEEISLIWREEIEEKEKLEKEKEKLSGDLHQIERRINLLDREREEWEREREEKKEEINTGEKLLAQKEGEKREIERRWEEAKSSLEEKEREIGVLIEEKERLNLLISSYSKEIESSKQEKSGIEERINSSKERMREWKDKREELRKEEEKNREERGRIVKERERVEEEREQLLKRLKEISMERESIKKEIEEEEEIFSRLQEKKEGVGTSLQEMEIELAKVKMEIKNLEDSLLTRYGMGLDSLPSPVSTQEESLEEEIKELRERLEKMGEVNLTAWEEKKEVEERYNFYLQQIEDLEESERNLRESIKRIEETTRSLFLNTLRSIRKEFAKIFRELFSGGEATLRLTGEENFEEKGVEIFVQPPGKKLQNLSLLSAGEKSLVAIALLFSLFRIKPSPFCVLDEVDAPLDEPNVERFARFLKELAQNTQFLVISHNKRTLSQADVLYGVTMEEPGVSKIISVSLKEAEERINVTQSS